MFGIYCEVAKGRDDFPIKVLYILDEKFTGEKNWDIFYGILNTRFGIRKVKTLETFIFEDYNKVSFKYGGYINLSSHSESFDIEK